MTWWHNETYNIGEVVQSIRRPGLWKETNEINITRPGFYKELSINITTIHSPYGRCYAIYFYNTLKSVDEFYALKINTATVSKVTIYLHESHNEIGLLWSYWPINPVTVELADRDQFIVTSQKNTYTPRVSKSMLPCNNDEEYSYPKCVTKWLRRKYIDMFAQLNKTSKFI